MFDTDFVNTKVVRARVEETRDPKNMGRVKVSYPWLKDSENVVSKWARVCFPMASDNAGFWFSSNVGDEVLAMIEDDDLFVPTIIGHLYSEKNETPISSLGTGPDKKYFKTASGSEIVLDERSDVIQLKSSSGSKLKLGPDGIAFGASGVELLDTLVEILNSFIKAAPIFCSTSVGPGVLNPALLQKLMILKLKIELIKGGL